MFPPNHYKVSIYLSGHVADLVGFLTCDPLLIWNTGNIPLGFLPLWLNSWVWEDFVHWNWATVRPVGKRSRFNAWDVCNFRQIFVNLPLKPTLVSRRSCRRHYWSERHWYCCFRCHWPSSPRSSSLSLLSSKATKQQRHPWHSNWDTFCFIWI